MGLISYLKHLQKQVWENKITSLRYIYIHLRADAFSLVYNCLVWPLGRVYSKGCYCIHKSYVSAS